MCFEINNVKTPINEIFSGEIRDTLINISDYYSRNYLQFNIQHLQPFKNICLGAI